MTENINEILEEVGNDPEAAQAALDAEIQEDEPRVTLVAALEKVIEEASSEDDEEVSGDDGDSDSSGDTDAEDEAVADDEPAEEEEVSEAPARTLSNQEIRQAESVAAAVALDERKRKERAARLST